ncbi:glycerol-3-phosphate regulon repressor, DeoR family [Yersinia pestis biovar Orientalis str. PEXU2]|nr:glycerol-3-phosphate regulon repressor, DeoR family [Yersinia pestis biovar Orientalis str. PEXU2]
MIPIERHQKILALVAERGVVSIAELTERLGVSHMTIRRDVQKLEEQGCSIVRFRRGAFDTTAGN